MSLPYSLAWPSSTAVAGHPVVLVLAGGKGERFLASGGQVHKLAAPLAGYSVLSQTVASVFAAGLAWHVVWPDAAQPCMGDSIAAGVAATRQASAWLVLPGDMPGVAESTFHAVAARLAEGAEGGAGALGDAVQAARPSWQGRLGHPVGFAASQLLALQGLTRQAGAARVWQSCVHAQIDVADPGCVMDIDTLDDLDRMAAHLQAHAQRGLT